MSIQLWIYVSLSIIGLGLTSWIVIPAPTFSLLPLAVGAPEISPMLLLGQLVLLVLLLLHRSKSWVYSAALLVSVLGIVLSSWPLLRLPATLQRANQAMQMVLGNHDWTSWAEGQHTPMRPQPFVFKNLFNGIAIPTIQPHRQFFLTHDGVRLPVNIYSPVNPITAPPYPAIATLYGGAWQNGDPDQNDTFNRYMAGQGYTVVAIDYRHAPQHRFPTQLQDVQAALKWMADHAIALNIDRTRIAMMGWSSGAHLALLAAYQTQTVPIRAVVNYYGPTNLIDGYNYPPRPDPINTRAVLEALLGGSPAQLRPQYEQASPIQQVKPGLPPTLLIYGQRDHIVKPVFGQQLHDQLQRTGNQAVLIPLPWAEHAFDAVFRGLSNQIALYYTERFLAWALR